MNSDEMSNVRTSESAANGGRIDSNASPDAIERQIDARRARIDRQLGELEERMSPKQLLNQGMDLFRDQGGDVANRLGRSFRDNPAPFIVAGVGLAWLMASTSRSSRNSYDGYEAHDDHDDYRGRNDRERYGYGRRSSRNWSDSVDGELRYGDLSAASPDYRDSDASDESMFDKAGNVIDELGDRASDLVDSASEKVDHARERGVAHKRHMQQEAHYRMQQMRDSGRHVGIRARRGADDVSQYLQEQPLIGGLLGLAAGAVIGSLLPPSDMEDDLMGEQSDRLTRVAAERAAEGAESAREKVESAASDIKQSTNAEIEKRSTTSAEAGATEPA